MHYASDVTRTFPVSGVFSSAQRDVYDIVLAANRAAIDACRPGNHFNHPHEAATLILVEGLMELGLLHGDPEQLIAQEITRDFVRIRPPIGWVWTSTT